MRNLSDDTVQKADMMMRCMGIDTKKKERKTVKRAVKDIRGMEGKKSTTAEKLKSKLEALQLLVSVIAKRSLARGEHTPSKKMEPVIREAMLLLVAGEIAEQQVPADIGNDILDGIMAAMFDDDDD